MMQKDDMNNIFKTVLVEAHVHISFHKKKRIVIKATPCDFVLFCQMQVRRIS